MKKSFFPSVLFALALVSLSSRFGFAGTSDDVKIPTDVSWEAQRDNKNWEDEQNTIDATKNEASKAINALRVDVIAKIQSASEAQQQIEKQQKYFLALRSIIPRDPWRKIYGETKYVAVQNSPFVKFSGQIEEVTQNGIRVFGKYGDSEETEFFILNFPYRFSVGESVDPTKIYVAQQDGQLSFITEDGYAKKIPKLNYGKPCPRPANADAVEQAARQLSSQEEGQLNALRADAKLLDELAIAAQNNLKKLIADSDLVYKTAIEKLKTDKVQSLKRNQEQAKRGEVAGLRRMGERYRDGDGEEKDLIKSAEYYQKAEVALQAEVNRIATERNEEEQKALKQKFLKNLALADESRNVESMIYVGQCYRDGLGIEKNLVKAKEYFDKAISAGVPQQPNAAPYYDNLKLTNTPVTP